MDELVTVHRSYIERIMFYACIADGFISDKDYPYRFPKGVDQYSAIWRTEMDDLVTVHRSYIERIMFYAYIAASFISDNDYPYRSPESVDELLTRLAAKAMDGKELS